MTLCAVLLALPQYSDAFVEIYSLPRSNTLARFILESWKSHHNGELGYMQVWDGFFSKSLSHSAISNPQNSNSSSGKGAFLQWSIQFDPSLSGIQGLSFDN